MIGDTFTGTYLVGKIKLSDEHDACRWAYLNELGTESLPHVWILEIVKRDNGKNTNR